MTVGVRMTTREFDRIEGNFYYYKCGCRDHAWSYMDGKPVMWRSDSICRPHWEEAVKELFNDDNIKEKACTE